MFMFDWLTKWFIPKQQEMQQAPINSEWGKVQQGDFQEVAPISQEWSHRREKPIESTFSQELERDR
jgi:hypothetical protein